MAMFVVKSIHIQINSQVMDLSIGRHDMNSSFMYNIKLYLSTLMEIVLSIPSSATID